MTKNLKYLTYVALIAFTCIGIGSTSVHAADASFTTSSLTSTKVTPKLSGEATDVTRLRLVITDENDKRVFKSDTIRVRDEKWKVTVSKKLKVGTYTATLYDMKSKEELASEDLTITAKNAKSSTEKKAGKTIPTFGSVSVSMLPLLMGGNAALGSSVPVAYLKVQNTSTETVTLQGFEFAQAGTAASESVIGFATSDDKGGSRTTVGGTEGTKMFTKGIAFVPLEATIAPNQVRIFTVKAIISTKATAQIGKQLALVVNKVRANGGIRTTYPIQGTTFVITK